MFPPLLLLLTPQLLHIFVLLLSLPPLNVLHLTCDPLCIFSIIALLTQGTKCLPSASIFSK